ncbi:uncharacterized protein SETTUDRAFT_21219 [Exserohilum turcica Et28A]|uniref:Uncharacterized protein n=1 Tax=Exserohilum turcicum (strain 28A) TaxID=671987 RepID=R0JRX3_EXST2|nr:uncharacterized protein SETTUDRAFT_21219 [Exserohilum turcica Et28A]EOA83873.1 hypothetical protein SETTUDRAFT_21219 [Exserohilum turcica Et28A]
MGCETGGGGERESGRTRAGDAGTFLQTSARAKPAQPAAKTPSPSLEISEAAETLGTGKSPQPISARPWSMRSTHGLTALDGIAMPAAAIGAGQPSSLSILPRPSLAKFAQPLFSKLLSRRETWCSQHYIPIPIPPSCRHDPHVRGPRREISTGIMHPQPTATLTAAPPITP